MMRHFLREPSSVSCLTSCMVSTSLRTLLIPLACLP